MDDLHTYLNHPPAETVARFAARLTEWLSLSDYEKIERLVAAARPLQETRPALTAWVGYAQGMLTREAGDYPGAIAQFERLRASDAPLPDDLAAQLLNSLGLAYELNEQWDRAMQTYEAAVAVCERSGDAFRLGKTLANLAILHYKGGDYEAAAASAERSATLLAENPADKSWQINMGNALNEWGLSLLELGRFEAARQALARSLEIDKRWDKVRGQAISHTNLGRVYQAIGDVAQAAHHYDQARQLALAVDDRFELAEIAWRQGTAHVSNDNLTEAAAALTEALTLAQQHHNHEFVSDIHLSRAALYDRLGKPPQALVEIRHAVEAVESLRANIDLPEARIRLQGARLEPYEQMVSRLCRSERSTDRAEAFRYAEMAKSRALVEMLAHQPLRPPADVPPAWLTEAAAVREQLRHLYHQTDAPPDQIIRLESQLHNLRRQIHQHNAEFESFHSVSTLSLNEVMARLPAGVVLVEYFTTGDDILAFTVTADDFWITPLPLRVRDLDKAFSGQRGAQSAQLRALTRPAQGALRQPWILQKLYQALIEPLGRRVQEASLLCIVPHGRLHYLPFHALYRPAAAGPDYLGQPTRPIIYAPSATTLLDYCQNKPRSPHQGCLALGFNGPATSMTQAEIEAQALARMVGGRSYTGTEAAKQQLKAEGGAYRYLHFSCHAHFNPQWPTLSHLRLADGPLSVTDILHDLRLQAELVSLSACETGMSHILQGDELIGLVRAFLYAGTPALLASHWPVDEVATRLLMERFYHRLTTSPDSSQAGRNAHALSQAQHDLRQMTVAELRAYLTPTYDTATLEAHLAYLGRLAGLDPTTPHFGTDPLFAHPYFWGGFFLVGDRL